MITTAVRGVSFTPKSLSAQGFAKMVIVNHDDDPKPIRRPLPVYSSQQMQNFSDDDDNDGSTRVSVSHHAHLQSVTAVRVVSCELIMSTVASWRISFFSASMQLKYEQIEYAFYIFDAGNQPLTSCRIPEVMMIAMVLALKTRARIPTVQTSTHQRPSV